MGLAVDIEVAGAGSEEEVVVVLGRRLLRVGIGGEGRGRRWVGLDMAAGTGVGGGGRIDRRAPWKNRGGTGLVLKRGVGGQSGEEHSARNFMNDVREKSTRPVQRHH